MTKALITIAIVAIVGLGAWQIFEYWQKVQDEKASEEKQAASSVVNEDSLQGLPEGWQTSLHAAEQGGASALGNWLKTYGNGVQDPRKAWIQLNYVVLITRDNPQEAKRLFADVKDRTLPNSPVWPRIQAMQKTYE
jgi:hypothetical protein